jgi:hypothetical protein
VRQSQFSGVSGDGKSKFKLKMEWTYHLPLTLERIAVHWLNHRSSLRLPARVIAPPREYHTTVRIGISE